MQPRDSFRVQVVGRFIEQQHVRRFEQQFAQRHTAPFTARQVCGHRVIGGAAQRLQRDVDLRVQIPKVLRVDLVLELRHLIGGLIRVVHRQLVVAIQNVFLGLHTQHHVFTHVEGFVQVGFLRQVANFGPLGGPRLTCEILVHSGHDFHQGGFTCAVHANDANLHAGQKAQADVLKALLATGIGLGHAVHVVDILISRHWGPPNVSQGCSRGAPRGQQSPHAPLPLHAPPGPGQKTRSGPLAQLDRAADF